MERPYRQNNPILRKLFLDIVPSSPADVTRRVNVFVEDGNAYKKPLGLHRVGSFLTLQGFLKVGATLGRRH